MRSPWDSGPLLSSLFVAGPLMTCSTGSGLFLEDLASGIWQTVSSCALRRGEHYAASDKPERSRRRRSSGLLADPYDERPASCLVRAADAAGNQAGIESSLHRLAADAPRSTTRMRSMIHPDTADLYRSLVSRPVQAANAQRRPSWSATQLSVRSASQDKPGGGNVGILENRN